jgi:hypothetical protein
MLTTLVALALMFMVMPLAHAEANSTSEMSNATDDNTTIDSNATSVNDSIPALYSESNATDDDTTIDSNATSTEEEVFPKNETASKAKIGWAKIKLWFTFDQATKAEKELEVANMMLAMANQAIANNDSETAAKYMDAYNLMMKDVQRRTDLAEGGNVNQTSIRLVALNNAIYVHEKKIAFLETKLASANLTEEQQAKLESKIAHAENVTSQLQELHDQKEEKLKTQLMATQNLTEEQANEKIAKMEEKYSVPALKERAKELKEQAKEENKTVGELVKEQTQELREQLKEQKNNQESD